MLVRMALEASRQLSSTSISKPGVNSRFFEQLTRPTLRAGRGCGRWVLRRFRGVHKKYLAQYVAIFEWEHNLKEVTGEFFRMLMDPGFTLDPT